MLTQNQIQDLLSTIDNQILIFVASNIGYDFLSTNDKQKLKNIGVDISKLKGKEGYIETAFKFGILSSAIPDKQAKKMKYKDLKEYLRSEKFIPLNQREKGMIQSIKNQSLSDIKGFGDRMKSDVHDVIDDESRKFYTDTIKEQAERGVTEGLDVKQISSEISHKTDNWNRDFDRISDYVMHTAFDEGRASSIQQKSEGGDPYVYKDVYPGACKHCIRLYLTNGIGSKPKIFKLSELKANGSNIGRKANEWLPVLGPTHPYCRCSLNEVPEGYEWSDDKKMFIPSKKERKVPRKSRAKVYQMNE